MVKPRDGTVKEGWANPAILNNVRHLPRTSEDKLVLAVLAGNVDVTSLPLPPSMSLMLFYSTMLLSNSLSTVCLRLARDGWNPTILTPAVVRGG